MLFGFIIVFLGVLFLLETIFPNFEVQFSIVWPIIVLMISLSRILKYKKMDMCTGIIFLIGIWYLLYNLAIIPTPFTDVFWPILFIVVGTSIIWNHIQFQKKIEKGKKASSMPSYYGVFSGIEETINTEDFKGANLYAVFGGVDLDLSKIQLKEDITINVYAIFGAADVKLPSNVNVKLNASAFFGGNENKANQSEKKGNKNVQMNCISIFGGTEIK